MHTRRRFIFWILYKDQISCAKYICVAIRKDHISAIIFIMAFLDFIFQKFIHKDIFEAFQRMTLIDKLIFLVRCCSRIRLLQIYLCIFDELINFELALIYYFI